MNKKYCSISNLAAITLSKNVAIIITLLPTTNEHSNFSETHSPAEHFANVYVDEATMDLFSF